MLCNGKLPFYHSLEPVVLRQQTEEEEFSKKVAELQEKNSNLENQISTLKVSVWPVSYTHLTLPTKVNV